VPTAGAQGPPCETPDRREAMQLKTSVSSFSPSVGGTPVLAPDGDGAAGRRRQVSLT
jgi:hypothetical protein